MGIDHEAWRYTPLLILEPFYREYWPWSCSYNVPGFENIVPHDRPLLRDFCGSSMLRSFPDTTIGNELRVPTNLETRVLIKLWSGSSISLRVLSYEVSHGSEVEQLERLPRLLHRKSWAKSWYQPIWIRSKRNVLHLIFLISTITLVRLRYVTDYDRGRCTRGSNGSKGKWTSTNRICDSRWGSSFADRA